MTHKKVPADEFFANLAAERGVGMLCQVQLSKPKVVLSRWC
jgi:hypothetical protein